MKMGRPKKELTEDDLSLRDEICRRLAAGETLRQICLTPDYPAPSTVVGWCEDAKFAEQYACARHNGLDAIAEEIIEIADETGRDTISSERGNIPNSEWIARSRLRVDARKWLLSKLRPEKYGDRSAVEMTGPNGGAIKIERTSAKEILLARISGIAARIEAPPDNRKPDGG